MQRRHLLLAMPLVPLALLTSYLFGAHKRRTFSASDVREQAIQLDQLASNIHAFDDARRLTDFIAGVFAEQLPAAWTKRDLRDRVALSEYTAVTEPSKGIPEQHVADTWNQYVITLGAPDETHVSAAEIHNLRDAFLAVDHLYWDRGHQNIWTVPSIYATQPDGSLAPSCRAIESLRILWDLGQMPENLRAARERVRKGVLASDQFRQIQLKPPYSTMGSAMVVAGKSNNPVELARRNFVGANGNRAFRKAVGSMLNTLVSV